jgi:hypothetical protein
MTYQQLHATASHVAHQSQGKTSKTCKKRKDGVLRKAPQAPRRFKSSYILFFMAKQNEIKRTLPPGSSVSVHFSIVAHLMSITSLEGQKSLCWPTQCPQACARIYYMSAATASTTRAH